MYDFLHFTLLINGLSLLNLLQKKDYLHEIVFLQIHN